MATDVSASLRGRKAHGSDGIMLAALDCFPKEHRETWTFQQNWENHVCACTIGVFICLHTVVVWSVDSSKAWFCHIHAENDFPTMFGILLSTTNFLLEHKMQHTCRVPVQKHKSSYTNWFWWCTVNKQKSFQQCDYVYKNQRIGFVELDNLLFITALLAMSILKHTNHDRFMESLCSMFFGPLVLKFAGEHHSGFCWIVLDYNMNNIGVLIRLKTNLTYANSQRNLRWSCVLAHRWLQLWAIGLESLLIEKNGWAHPWDNDMCSGQSGLDIFSVIWVHDVLGMCISHIYKHCICLSLL